MSMAPDMNFESSLDAENDESDKEKVDVESEEEEEPFNVENIVKNGLIQSEDNTNF